MKRLIDILISIILLIILFPFMMLVAILIKLDSEGDVFFIQLRSGLLGKSFYIYKFRSMVKDAERLKDSLKEKNEMNGPVFKMQNDPRVTTIGKILRKYSIDELPQLINVIKGEMSIVGPRPPLISEVQVYKPYHKRRLTVKPGLTCLWQIKGRNEIDFEKWVELDLQYIDNWSLMLDFKIMYKTIFTIFSAKGAS